MTAATAATRQIPLLDLNAQHRTIRDEVLGEIIRVVDSQKFILGEGVKTFENDIAAYCSTKYAIGCASGSDALFLALLAADIGPGDKVLTTPYTFFATIGAICRAAPRPYSPTWRRTRSIWMQARRPKRLLHIRKSAR